MMILCDIGGTFARLAQSGGGAISTIRKYAVADYQTFEDALAAFCSEENIPNQGTIAIATAAYEDGPKGKEIWRFVNRNKWVLDAAALKRAGWSVATILNDFAAATWGLQNLAVDDFEVLKDGAAIDAPLCLMGPGTGLGLGYLMNGYVQRTHGGHMLAAALTEEQQQLINTAQTLKEGGAIVSFENLASGPGLQNIYASLCKMRGIPNKFERAEDILNNEDDALVKDALRLFHEFLGIFAQNAVITAHAYGGLYLTGGMVDRLKARNLFDFKSFEKFFVLKSVDSVTRALDATPIYYVTHPSLAMKGLMESLA